MDDLEHALNSGGERPRRASATLITLIRVDCHVGVHSTADFHVATPTELKMTTKCFRTLRIYSTNTRNPSSE